jgi:hypothetical protein
LADRLGLKLARQEWSTLLDLIAGKTRREIGDDYDLTWNVVYGPGGHAEGLGRYFSNGDKAPGTTLLDPKDQKQRADYERKLKKIYEHSYKLQKVEGVTKVIRVARPT